MGGIEGQENGKYLSIVSCSPLSLSLAFSLFILSFVLSLTESMFLIAQSVICRWRVITCLVSLAVKYFIKFILVSLSRV